MDLMQTTSPFLLAWGAAYILVVWWAGVWGRNWVVALFGALVLSPLIWGIVPLVLSRKRDEPSKA
jgi:hypothetical protein